ncbi:MAG: ATP-dependent DNA helicase RecG, partial [Oscillospiraceae bacterium]|nr:ATP-dependent DNA helicase RecG [Oscillospiraceae bacterium]
MEILEQEVRYLKGVGEARAKALNRLGIYSVRDLLNHFPRAYEDRTRFFTILDAPMEEAVCIRAYVTAPPVLTVVRGGKRLVKLRAADESGSVDIAYFNMPYIREQLHAGERYLFYGKL